MTLPPGAATFVVVGLVGLAVLLLVMTYNAGRSAGEAATLERLRPERMQADTFGKLAGVLSEMQAEHGRALADAVQIAGAGNPSKRLTEEEAAGIFDWSVHREDLIEGRY